MHDLAFFDNPSLTIACALVAGMLAQSVARHIRVPGIVVLLLVGVALGPDVTGVVRPATLGNALHMLVGFAVAIILFEGGLNLRFARLRRVTGTVRHLVLLGPIVTTAGAALLVHFLLGWDVPRSLLFGTLVIVTGPTVVTPLLRRLDVKKHIAAVLEAEGVLIDAVGSVIAVVALDLVLHSSDNQLLTGFVGIGSRLGLGAAIGVAGGLLLALLLRTRHLIPEGFENVFVLCLVIGLFQISNAIIPESGIAAVTAAGIALANSRTPVDRDLHQFKEQLTTMFIGMLFVLLAADVRLAEVQALGLEGLGVVVALVLLVRPAVVLLATWGSDLPLRERAFISWIGPRGIVAAAIASLFASEMSQQQIDGGKSLLALVFLTIAVTVSLAGLTGPALARLFGLQRRPRESWLIVGAGPVALEIARQVEAREREVVLIDSDPDRCRAAEELGMKVVFGNPMQVRTLKRAGVDGVDVLAALTDDGPTNLLVLHHARRVDRIRRRNLVVGDKVTRQMAEQVAGADALPFDTDQMAQWDKLVEQGLAQVELRDFASWENDRCNPNVIQMLIVEPDGLRLASTGKDPMADARILVLERDESVGRDDAAALAGLAIGPS